MFFFFSFLFLGYYLFGSPTWTLFSWDLYDWRFTDIDLAQSSALTGAFTRPLGLNSVFVLPAWSFLETSSRFVFVLCILALVHDSLYRGSTPMADA